jgi:hypothetical protein
MANDDSYQPIKCPSCGQYISNQVNSCRFCNGIITDEMKAQAIDLELEDNRKFRLKSHKMFVFSGLGTLGLGLLLLLVSLYTMFFTNDGRFFLWSPVLMILGVGQMMYGSFGMFEERKKKKDR